MLDHRLLVVTGKGGVGKSAMAAAIALRAARDGRQVLAIAMTDGSGLAAHLRAGELRTEPEEVRPGLTALAIEPSHALEEYLRMRLKVPRLGVMTRAFRVLADTVPGIRDTVVIGKVIYEATRPHWDLVVADAPPTGQVLSYLQAPEAIESLVPGGRVREQAAWMRSVLRDPRQTGVALVATPEDLPVAEAVETRDALVDGGIASVAAVIANRVAPPLAVDDATIAAEPPGARRDAATLHREVQRAQEEHLIDLAPTRTFPLFLGLRTPGEVSSRLSEIWESS